MRARRALSDLGLFLFLIFHRWMERHTDLAASELSQQDATLNEPKGHTNETTGQTS